MQRPTHVGTRGMLEELLARRIFVLDGAMGSMIYAHEPKEEDYRGSRFRQHPCSLKNCTDVLARSQPEMIEGIHRAYLEAGSDIIETCTFNATPLALTEFGLLSLVPREIGRLSGQGGDDPRPVLQDYVSRTACLVLWLMPLVAAACLVAVIVEFVADRQLTLPEITSRAWLAIFLSGAIGLSASFVLFVRMISRHGPTAAVLATYVMPVVAAVLGVIILGETITPSMLAGSLLVLVGVVVFSQAR